MHLPIFCPNKLIIDEKDTKHAFAVTFDKKWKAAQEAKAEQAEKEEAEPVAAGSSSSPLASQKQIRVKTAEEIAAAAAAAPPPLLAPPGSAAASGYAVRKPSLTGQTAPSTGLLDLMGDDSDVVNTTSSGNAYTSTESVPVNKTANANPFDMFDNFFFFKFYILIFIKYFNIISLIVLIIELKFQSKTQ